MIVAISSSNKFFHTVPEIQKQLQDAGITVFIPHLDYTSDPKLLAEYAVEFDNYIQQCDYLYINNINGYIGVSVAQEIGFARGLHKPVFFREKPADEGLVPFAVNILSIAEVISFFFPSSF